jgi:PHIKZ175|nr:MAG TPA: Prohead core protein protease [Caudoviricetes sp.]
MAQLMFNNTALMGTNKVGDLKSDENGYYYVCLGALEYPNSYGATYDLNPGKELLSSTSPFMRQIKKGQLWGEYGHPEKDGLTNEQYLQRIYTVREKFQSHHIREVIIDENATDVNGRKFIAIYGWVKPSGPYAQYLEKQLKDKDQCVSFSIRSLTNDKMVGGKLTKALVTIITWDYVGEPGLDVATKWNSPALEELDSYTFSTSEIKSLLAQQQASGHGLESSCAKMMETLRRVESAELPKQGKPSWVGW